MIDTFNMTSNGKHLVEESNELERKALLAAVITKLHNHRPNRQREKMNKKGHQIR